MSGIIPEIRIYSPSEKGEDDSSESDVGKRYFPNGGGTKLTLVRTQTGFQTKLVSKVIPGSPNSRSRDGASSEPSVSQTEVSKDSHLFKPESDDSNCVNWENTFHMRPFNLSNSSNTTYRSTHRSQMMAINRTRNGFISSTSKSLDILRQNLQKKMNKDIDEVVQRYISKFFRPGMRNIVENNGTGSVSEYHVHSICRQILDEAKKMYQLSCNSGGSGTGGLSSSHKNLGNSLMDQSSDVENASDGRSRRLGRKRKESDTDSEASIVPKVRRKKGRPPIHHQNGSGRSTPSKIKNDPVRREGPKWDPNRLTPETLFIMGAKANKALGLGATRGRLYIKHPDVFKYSGDQDDKQWLYDHNLMPATGGKAYMLLVEDIRELAETDEYRNSPGLAVDEIIGFTVSESILSKMKDAMYSMRTNQSQSKKRARNILGVSDALSDRGSSIFTDTKSAEDTGQEESRTVSPMEDLELLNTGPSPYILDSCFDDVSPAQPEISPMGSDMSTINEPPMSAPFDITCANDN